MPRAYHQLVSRGRRHGTALLAIGIALLTLVAAAHSQLHLLVAGLLGETYDVQGSNNLRNWTLVSSLVNTSGVVEVAQQGDGPFKFYRVLVTSPGSTTHVAQRAGLAMYFAAGSPPASQTIRIASEDHAMQMVALQRAAAAPQEVEPLFTSFAAAAAVEAIRQLPAGEFSQTVIADAAAQAARRIVGICSNALPGFPALNGGAYARMLGGGAAYGAIVGTAIRRFPTQLAVQVANLAAQKAGGTAPDSTAMTTMHTTVSQAVPSGAMALQNSVFSAMRITAALPPPPPPPPSGGGGGGGGIVIIDVVPPVGGGATTPPPNEGGNPTQTSTSGNL